MDPWMKDEHDKPKVFSLAGFTPDTILSLAQVKKMKEDAVSKIKHLGGEYLELDTWDERITHVVVSKKGSPGGFSEKVMGAIAAARWVVSLRYVEKSFDRGEWLDNPGNFARISDQVLVNRKNFYEKGQSGLIFRGFRVVLLTSCNRKNQVYSRIVQAGGGMAVNRYKVLEDFVRCLDSLNPGEITHVFVDPWLRNSSEVSKIMDHNFKRGLGLKILYYKFLVEKLRETENGVSESDFYISSEKIRAIAEREKELWIRSLNGGTKRKDPFGRQDGSKKKKKEEVITLSDSDSELTIIDIPPRNKKTVVEEIISDDEDIQVLEEKLNNLRREAGVGRQYMERVKAKGPPRSYRQMCDDQRKQLNITRARPRVISLDVETEMVTLDDSDDEVEVVMSPRRRTSSGYSVRSVSRSPIDIASRSPSMSPDRNDLSTIVTYELPEDEIHSTTPASQYERMDSLEDIVLPSENLSSTNGTSFMEDQRLYPLLERDNIRVIGSNAKEYCEPSLPEVNDIFEIPKSIGQRAIESHLSHDPQAEITELGTSKNKIDIVLEDSDITEVDTNSSETLSLTERALLNEQAEACILRREIDTSIENAEKKEFTSNKCLEEFSTDTRSLDKIKEDSNNKSNYSKPVNIDIDESPSSTVLKVTNNEVKDQEKHIKVSKKRIILKKTQTNDILITKSPPAPNTSSSNLLSRMIVTLERRLVRIEECVAVTNINPRTVRFDKEGERRWLKSAIVPKAVEVDPSMAGHFYQEGAEKVKKNVKPKKKINVAMPSIPELEDSVRPDELVVSMKSAHAETSSLRYPSSHLLNFSLALLLNPHHPPEVQWAAISYLNHFTFLQLAPVWSRDRYAWLKIFLSSFRQITDRNLFRTFDLQNPHDINSVWGQWRDLFNRLQDNSGGPYILISYLTMLTRRDLELWWRHDRRSRDNHLPLIYYLLGGSRPTLLSSFTSTVVNLYSSLLSLKTDILSDKPPELVFDQSSSLLSDMRQLISMVGLLVSYLDKLDMSNDLYSGLKMDLARILANSVYASLEEEKVEHELLLLQPDWLSVLVSGFILASKHQNVGQNATNRLLKTVGQNMSMLQHPISSSDNKYLLSVWAYRLCSLHHAHSLFRCHWHHMTVSKSDYPVFRHLSRLEEKGGETKEMKLEDIRVKLSDVTKSINTIRAIANNNVRLENSPLAALLFKMETLSIF